MADPNDTSKPSQPAPLDRPAANITVVRMIEYHGPHEWVELVLKNSAMPLQGTHLFKPGRLPSGEAMEGAFIRSGLVMFNAEDEGAVAAPAGAQAQAQAGPSVEVPDGKGGKTVIHLPMPPGGKPQA
jgi:hypothetical protein